MDLAYLVLAGPDNCQKKLGVLKSLWTMFPEDHELVLVRHSFKGLPNTKTSSSTSKQSDHFILRTVSFCDVKKTIRSVNSYAVGLDGISLKFIKLILPEIVSPIAHIFNKTISSKTFPCVWKFLKIVTVSKLLCHRETYLILFNRPCGVF
jgi:hypothetical protein